jgi:hypothetical protein
MARLLAGHMADSLDNEKNMSTSTGICILQGSMFLEQFVCSIYVGVICSTSRNGRKESFDESVE